MFFHTAGWGPGLWVGGQGRPGSQAPLLTHSFLTPSLIQAANSTHLPGTLQVLSKSSVQKGQKSPLTGSLPSGRKTEGARGVIHIRQSQVCRESQVRDECSRVGQCG